MVKTFVGQLLTFSLVFISLVALVKGDLSVFVGFAAYAMMSLYSRDSSSND